ncbi:flagellin N-terminal helical domain-containing protein [Shinella zoogloeoides]|uniref:flagellin N-terminal helical domain-containing protein n=1 Tax=Shinella zoogloeoides TaxID=352475 RepID=UPI00273FE484|nr:flagellin [Shinella zoogloeoides]WLR91319.1 flagellin [Shinella zoogloeoides]
MTSIHTNASAISALQTLRTVTADLQHMQAQISSGKRVQNAVDNAAYWSISTTMRSDRMAISAVSDALGLGAAKVDVAYSGLSSVIDILSEFSGKLVLAAEGGVDKSKVQAELEQLKQQVLDVSMSSSFSGENWLNTNIPNIYDNDLNRTALVASFVRTPSSGVAVETIDFHRSEVSLFNSAGGGLLQADARDSKTIGGIRGFTPTRPIVTDSTAYNGSEGAGWMIPMGTTGSSGSFALDAFPVGSTLDFTSPGAEISFDIILDREASNPDSEPGLSGELQDLPGPFYAGYTASITITKADVDAWRPELGGKITTNTEFAGLLSYKLHPHGAYVSATSRIESPPGSQNWIHDPERMSIQTLQHHGDGSYVEIANLTSVGISTGGLREASDFGRRGSGMNLAFKEFIVHEDGDNVDGVEISFAFGVNNAAPKAYSFNRSYVNDILGKETGKVETSDEMATLLKSLLDEDWPDLIIEAKSPSAVLIKSDPSVDRAWGSGTRLEFDNIRVSIEPLPTLNFLEIDVEQNPDMIATYIDYMDVVAGRVTDGATSLGALHKRIDMQAEFAARMMATLDKGVGRLVDADMNEASLRMKAIQTQQQLATQLLSIANSNTEHMLQLFR